ncbi:hypothetical protein ACFYZE_06865 [Streptomyces sp. NPDC001796]|uniref:hypothetical protein n=1 Tax=Streptomyces sp. NPDC001796 TaxID=3364609 RepID=UPI0036B1559A
MRAATGGRVLVGGRDVTDRPLPELRSAIGYVEQDAPVLAGTSPCGGVRTPFLSGPISSPAEQAWRHRS